MRWRIPLVVALALFMAVSCDQQPVEPAAEQVATVSTFDFSNGPAEPGNSFVVRDTYGDFWWLFYDDATGFYAVVTDQDWDCDATTLIDYDEDTVVPFQQIFNPSGEGLVMFFENGWLNASIFSSEECADFVASGLVHNQWMDNDVEAWLYEHNRSNAYGGGIHGNVGGYTFAWNFKCVWGGSTKDLAGAHCNESIHIK